jgi:hypothetical protein
MRYKEMMDRLTSCDTDDRKSGKKKLLREHDENYAVDVTSRC